MSAAGEGNVQEGAGAAGVRGAAGADVGPAAPASPGVARAPAVDGSAAEPAPLRLRSEFGDVAVSRDDRANGPRLRIEDLRNGRVIYLDPLELASLTWLTHDHLGPFLDPSQTGWRSQPA